MNTTTLFRILADEPDITDIGETTFIFEHGVVQCEPLDNGRVILSWRNYEQGYLTEPLSITLHNKGILKTSCKKDIREALSLFFKQPFEQLDKVWSSGSIIAWLKEQSNSDVVYQQWLDYPERHGIYAFALMMRNTECWHVYHNHQDNMPVLRIYPHDKKVIAHPCQKAWVLLARYLEETLKEAPVYTDAMISQHLKRFLSKSR